MRRFVKIAIAGFAIALAASAGDGVPPRAKASDYPVSRDAQAATIGAALVPPALAKKLFPADVSKDYVVVEVGVYPVTGQIADVDSFDFGLKLGPDDVSHPRNPEEIVSMWVEKNAPKPPDKPVDVHGETGVVYQSGNDPAYGRTKGWGTYSGVGVGVNEPTPPQPLSMDPRVVDAIIRGRALPEGPAARPIAGYLYFPVVSRKHKNAAPMELQYIKDGVVVTLPLPVK